MSTEATTSPETLKETDLPANLKNLWLKALSAIELKNYGYAISLLQAVLKEEPKYLEGRRVLRKAEVQKTKTEKKLIKFPSGGISAMKFQGQIKKDPLEALVSIEKVLENDPYNLQANQALHEAALAAELPDTACFALEIVREGHPDNTKVGHQIAQFYMSHDNPGAAAKVYQEIVKKDPTDLVAVQGEKNAVAMESTKRQGWESGNLKGLKKDEAESRKLEMYDKEGLTPEQMNEMLVDLGAKYAEDPNNLAVVKRIARLYEQLEDWENALTYYEWGYSISNRDAALENKASYIRDRMRSEELKSMEKDLESETDQAVIEQKQAEITKIRAEASERLIKEALDRVEKNPTDAQFRYDLGLRYFEAGMYTEAIPELQKAKNHASLRTLTLIMIGKCYEKKNMNDLAIRQFKEADEELLAMNDVKKDVLYNLGLVHAKTGDKTSSLDCMKVIYEADYGYRDVAKRVEESYSSDDEGGADQDS